MDYPQKNMDSIGIMEAFKKEEFEGQYIMCVALDFLLQTWYNAPDRMRNLYGVTLLECLEKFQKKA